MEFLNSLEYTHLVLAMITAIGCFTLGYHAGNRFRFTRIMMRDPKEVTREIKLLHSLIIDNQIKINWINTQEFKDKWKTDRLEAEIKIAKTKLALLNWIMSKENN